MAYVVYRTPGEKEWCRVSCPCWAASTGQAAEPPWQAGGRRTLVHLSVFVSVTVSPQHSHEAAAQLTAPVPRDHAGLAGGASSAVCANKGTFVAVWQLYSLGGGRRVGSGLPSPQQGQGTPGWWSPQGSETPCSRRSSAMTDRDLCVQGACGSEPVYLHTPAVPALEQSALCSPGSGAEWVRPRCRQN